VTDLLAFTAELVDIPSVSHDEQAITDHLACLLRGVPWLGVTRLGENMVARTEISREQREVAAGHSGNVPHKQNSPPRA